MKMPTSVQEKMNRPATRAPEATCWPSGPYLLRGMLYEPHASASAVVVLCNALWEEGECSRRVLTGLADYLSRQGIAALRFDYAGTGESTGHDYEVSISDYQRDLATAFAWARNRFPSARLVAIALRSGGNLLASTDLTSQLDSLFLIYPIVDFRKHWRDLRIVTKIVCPGISVDRGWPAPEGEARYVVRCGHRVNSSLERELHQLQFRVASPGPLAQAVLLDVGSRGDRGHAALFSQLKQHDPVWQQVQVDVPFFWRSHDLDRLELSRYQGLYDVIVDVLSESTSKQQTPIAEARCEGSAGSPPSLDPTWDFTSFAIPTTSGRVVMSLHRPARPRRGWGNAGVVLLPAFPQDRSGPQRLLLRVAQALSAAGLTTYRLDPIGCGDSSGTGEREEWERSFTGGYLNESLDYLRTQGMDIFVLIGLCSGAAIAARACLARDDVAGLAMLNPHRSEQGVARRVLLSGMLRSARSIVRGVNPVTAIRLFGIDSILYRLGIKGKHPQRVPIRSAPSRSQTNMPAGFVPDEFVLRKLTVPLLILYGEQSRYFSSFRHGLNGTLKFLVRRRHTSLVVIPAATDAFHAPESRTELADALLRWTMALEESHKQSAKSP